MKNKSDLAVKAEFDRAARAVVYTGDCLAFLRSLPSESIQLVVTSPPYNIGKPYEGRVELAEYVRQQEQVIQECARVLKPTGSICWQVGNYVDRGEIVPLDVELFPIFRELRFKMRNRIVWHFEHGLHCTKRLSGRYETINWFTKSDDFVFHLDPIRVPQKYPGKKHFKGPKMGQLSCNPLGKNPGDVWTIPNVKNNHVEKTDHPCQFPVELVERLVLALTNADDWVVDPYLGAGTSVVAAVKNGRRGAGSEILPQYARVAIDRIDQFAAGDLRTRPMGRPVHNPSAARKATVYELPSSRNEAQLKLMNNASVYARGRAATR